MVTPSRDALDALIQSELGDCSIDLRSFFQQVRVEPAR